jgi:hypothetical protein
MRLTISSSGTSISTIASMVTSAARVASAWARVRGKPSNRKPRPQSGLAMRSLTSPMISSSETSPPASMTALAWRPSSLPAATAARNMSPVEICGMPKRSQTNFAWVPLPAPGGPRRMSFMPFSLPVTLS